jgi:hypothetical protein
MEIYKCKHCGLYHKRPSNGCNAEAKAFGEGFEEGRIHQTMKDRVKMEYLFTVKQLSGLLNAEERGVVYEALRQAAKEE